MSNTVKATAAVEAEDVVPAVVTPDDNLLPFTFEGEKYSVDKSVFEDVDFQDALAREQTTIFMSMLVSPAGWRKFKSKGKDGKRTMTELHKFGIAAFDTIGVEAGE